MNIYYYTIKAIFSMGNCVNTQSDALIPRKKGEQSAQNSQNLLIDQKVYLDDLKLLILNEPKLMLLLSPKFFVHYFQELNKDYWTTSSRATIIRLLSSYIKFSMFLTSANRKNETRYSINNFSSQFGKDCFKILSEVRMKNVWLIKSLQYGTSFLMKQFNFEKYQQLVELTKNIRRLSSHSAYPLVYLSSTLLACCLKLQKSQISINEINRLLKEKVRKLNEDFSPKERLKAENQYNKRYFEQNEIHKLKSKKVPYQPKVFIFKTSEKEKELQDFIMEMVSQAKKISGIFTEITSSSCIESQGFFYKSNLKLKERSQQVPMLRVKQKLLKNIIGKYYQNKIYECKSIQQLQKAEKEYFKSVLTKIYDGMDSIQFTVSDILRGKCMFNKIADINKAFAKIQQKIGQRCRQGQKIDIVQVDNRLEKITTDLVIKIRINELVCQFQLALKFNQAESQIYHKMYEIERSKVFTPISMLLNWNSRLTHQFFSEADKVLSQHKDSKDEYETIVKRLKEKFNYLEATKLEQKKIYPDSDYYEIKRIKEEISQIKLIKQIPGNKNLRDAQSLRQIKKYREAVIVLEQYKQNYGEDDQYLYQKQQTLIKLNQWKESIENLEKIINKIKNFDNNQDQIYKLYTQLMECYIQYQKPAKALQILQKAFSNLCIETWSELLRVQHQLNIGKVKKKLGKHQQSIKNFCRCIQIYEKNQAYQDPNYPFAYRLLAQVYLQLELSSKALQCLHKALSLAQNIMGKQSLECAQIISLYGKVYQNLTNFEEAQKYLKQYESMTQNLCSRQSPQYASALLMLSILYLSQEKYDQSYKAICELQKIGQKVFDRSSRQYMHIMNTFGLYYFQIKEYQKALNYFQKSLNLLKQLGDELNPNFGHLYGNIAMVYQQMEENKKALQFLEKQQEILQKIYDPNSPHIALMKFNMIAFVDKVSSSKELVKNQLLDLLKMIQTSHNQIQKVYILTLEYLGKIEGQLGNMQESIKYFQKQLKVISSASGQNSAMYAHACLQIGIVISNTDFSVPFIEKAIEIYKHLNHYKIKQASQWLQNKLAAREAPQISYLDEMSW